MQTNEFAKNKQQNVRWLIGSYKLCFVEPLDFNGSISDTTSDLVGIAVALLNRGRRIWRWQ
ncbi:MAG: hypothetical protein ACI89J_004501 [Hyphomicrobiaceae bacterium]|jgi:hypothetical protein